MADDRRVVVTGLGVVSSLGIGWQEWWKNIMAGKSGISRITAFDVRDYEIQYAGEIKNFQFRDHLGKDNFSRLGKASKFAITASRLALKDAMISVEDISKKKAALSIGTTMGESQVIEQIVKHAILETDKEVKELRALAYPANSIALNLGHDLQVSGKNVIFANACAAGNYALGYGFDLIKYKNMDFVLAGGIDALSRIAFTGFNRLFAMAPEKCQPFDKNRKGMMLGEGAAMLILESMESALKRKAHVYAEVLGYGLSCDANHMTHPDYKGIRKAVEKALRSSGVVASDINYVSAHGTGTNENDKAESMAYHEIFKERIQDVPISSIKSMLGHSMGAASAFESIACCLALETSNVPPTINYENGDAECDIDCVPNQGREHSCNVVLNNSQAFGGNNACVLFKGVSKVRCYEGFKI